MLVIANDVELNIAEGTSAQAVKWKNTTTKWSEFANRLSQTIYTQETFDEFVAMSKQEQARVKDVGGYVGGYLEGGSRKKDNVSKRQLICLDIDFSTETVWTDFIIQYDCAALIHGTHKNCKKNPRHRLVIPLDRPVSAEEYQAISRWIANDLNIDLFDQSTFDVNRLMFWPSTPRDSEYYFEYQDGPILKADSVLRKYKNWKNTSEWPVANGLDADVLRMKTKQVDPEDKGGIIGTFCRVYNIHQAIEKFLSDIYDQVDDRRYTYRLGSTVGGLITYEDRFAYSHHGTDPAGGRLCNSFDLVRIHKFGDLDDTANSKKSLYAMEDFARNDSEIRSADAKERLNDARAAFGLDMIEYIDLTEDKEAKEEVDDIEWLRSLEIDNKGKYLNTASNLNIIFKNDKYLKDAFVLNTFDNKRYVKKNLPWRKVDGTDYLRDCDYAGLRSYIECAYGIVCNGKVDDALSLEFEKNKQHPILEYLSSLTWDGEERIDNLLIDYFGAKDCKYTKQAIRKMLVGAVARVYEPGVKFDTALILVGPQGCYKSTFIRKLGKGWSSDTFIAVQGKESFEQLQGCWIIEIAELAGLKKAEVETIKHYLSKNEDSFRPAYGRVVETYKRQCVFFGTTNTDTFLRDETGNRRFLPIDVNVDKVKKNVMEDLTDDEIDQIWAEAVQLYKSKEKLYLDKDTMAEAQDAQRVHTEQDERLGVIEEFLDIRFPPRYHKWDLLERKQWLNNPLRKGGIIIKNTACVAEIWCECFGRDKSDLNKIVSKELRTMMSGLTGWELAAGSKRFPMYGRQRYFKRIGADDIDFLDNEDDE